VLKRIWEREKSYKSAVTECDECTARRMLRGTSASQHPNRDCLSCGRSCSTTNERRQTCPSHRPMAASQIISWLSEWDECRLHCRSRGRNTGKPCTGVLGHSCLRPRATRRLDSCELVAAPPPGFNRTSTSTVSLSLPKTSYIRL
jgi:hypothetical protein